MNQALANQTNASDANTWRYGSLKVFYKPGFDLTAAALAIPFIKFIKQRSRYQSFPRILEWCSGPAFIGFAMLEEGMCDHLILTDSNPDAIACIEKTIQENNLQGQVTYYLSDNLRDIPESEKFDLVIGRPPAYVNINSKHPEGKIYQNNPRVCDPDWAMHRSFYHRIGNYLNPGAHLLISEIEPFKQAIYIPKTERTPYDIRTQMPIINFKEMIADGNLVFIDAHPYYTIIEGVTAYMVCSKKPAQLWKRLLFNVNTLE